MIVVNNLDTVFSYNLIEMGSRDHFSGFCEGILLYLRLIKDCCEILSRVEVHSNSPLILNLIQINIRHLHLFFMDRFISREEVVVLFEAFLAQS